MPQAISLTITPRRGPIIQVRRLDIDAALFVRLDLIKIDVEGYELNVLKGAEQLIEKFHPKMVIEINEIALEQAIHHTRGCYELAGAPWIPGQRSSSPCPEVPFYDILCCRHGKPPEASQGSGLPIHLVHPTPLRWLPLLLSLTSRLLRKKSNGMLKS